MSVVKVNGTTEVIRDKESAIYVIQKSLGFDVAQEIENLWNKDIKEVEDDWQKDIYTADCRASEEMEELKNNYNRIKQEYKDLKDKYNKVLKDYNKRYSIKEVQSILEHISKDIKENKVIDEIEYYMVRD